MAMMRWLLFVVLLLAGSAQAAIEIQSFDDPRLAERYEGLSRQLRCPMCQNESIAASNSPVAADMRERVAAMLREGATDAEVEAAMVDRFGDYVRYDPRFEARTWVLWGLPLALVVIGGGVVAAFVVRRRRLDADNLSHDERSRLDGLIARHETEDAGRRDDT